MVGVSPGNTGRSDYGRYVGVINYSYYVGSGSSASIGGTVTDSYTRSDTGRSYGDFSLIKDMTGVIGVVANVGVATSVLTLVGCITLGDTGGIGHLGSNVLMSERLGVGGNV